MRFRRFGDSALEYELLCWVSGPTRRRRAQHELNRALYVAMTEAGVEIPYPKRDVTFTPAPPTDVGSDRRSAADDGRSTADAEAEVEAETETDGRVADADD
jgi:small-conductance mechanosensitive channel